MMEGKRAEGRAVSIFLWGPWSALELVLKVLMM